MFESHFKEAFWKVKQVDEWDECVSRDATFIFSFTFCTELCWCWQTTMDWARLPAGVRFDPSDEELLEHLAAKVGRSGTRPHPMLDEFIVPLVEEDGICRTHPENLPGKCLHGALLDLMLHLLVCKGSLSLFACNINVRHRHSQGHLSWASSSH